MKPTYIFLANGFEEIEAVTPVDVLRRAGMEVVTVSVNESVEVTGAHGVTVKADTTIAALAAPEAEWLICPGGMPGATNLAECGKLTSMLTAAFKANGKIAAICAAPAVVLAPLGILAGREATCYPGFEQMCTDATMREQAVVALDTLITANGPASALRFALAIVANSLGQAKAAEVAQGMLAFAPETDNFY